MTKLDSKARASALSVDWTREEITLLVDAVRDGRSLNDLAACIGRSSEAVTAKARRLNLT